MSSRLDRLLSLLEHCPNATLRATAARQLGQLAKKAPEDVDATLLRLHGLLHSKSWRSRVAAAEAIRAMVSQLPAWKPTASGDAGESVAKKPETASPPSSSSSSFLSLSGLDLDHVLENGARLYSMDLRELSTAPITKSTTAKRSKKGTASDQKDCVPARGAELGVLLDRSEINRQLGLCGDAGSFISTVLEQSSDTSISKLISDADLHPEEVGADENEPDVTESVNRAYNRGRVDSTKEDHSATKEGDTTKPTQCSLHTDWPLNGICVRLLADLWDCRWETRHGAASGLRELLSLPQHTNQAGTRNGASDIENQKANRMYVEDIVVRVLCTLALDQFSDFACDVVVAPVRQTAAQLLGVLSLHLDFDQIQQVVHHLLCLVSMLKREEKQLPGRKRPATPKANWMVVHGGLLGLNYLLSARADLVKDLLPVVYPSLTSMLIDGAGESAKAGEEDLRSAACNALLAVPCDLLVSYGNTGDWLITQVWTLLEQANELSPATGPLLVLASELLKVHTNAPSTAHEVVAGGVDGSASGCASEKADDDSDLFSKRVNLVLHFLHHSSSEIRRTAVLTLQSLLSIRMQEGLLVEPAVLESVFEQLFHRILLESDPKPIRSICKLWDQMVNATPVPLLVRSTLSRVDFWLCQAMQPASLPFADNMLCLLTSKTSLVVPETSGRWYIGGYELGSTSERERQVLALETRITATSLLANLCSRLCQCSTSVISADPSDCQTAMSVPAYLLNRVVSEAHLKDRLAMQRFVASLLLAAWPPSLTNAFSLHTSGLQARIQACLTNVTYYEEILGVFKTMQEDCHRLRALCEATNLPVQTGLPKASEGVLNIVECQELLKRVSQDLPTAATAASLTLEVEEVKTALQKAQLSVHRCLALQLFWSSRVELSLSSALVNFGWVTSGRLTPLIRPFMETIRAATQPVSTASSSTSSSTDNDCSHQLLTLRVAADLPNPGENLRLQRLAAWNLVRLLWAEYRPSVSVEPNCTNPSKALVKVTQNLAKYILPDEYDEWESLIANAESEENGCHSVCLTVLLSKQPESTSSASPSEKAASSPTSTTSASENNGFSSSISSTAPQTPKLTSLAVANDADIARRQALSQLRRSGSLMTVIALLRTFTSDSTGSSLKDTLSRRLPTLWQFLWLEPLRVLRGGGKAGVADFSDDVEFLRHQPTQPLSVTPSDTDVLSRALYLMPAAFLACEDHASACALLEGLLALALRCLCLPGAPRLRYVAAHTLALIAVVSLESTVRTLNALLVGLMPSSSANDDGDDDELSRQIAALEAIYHIIDCILTPRTESLVFRTLRVAPGDQPLSPELHGVGLKEAVNVSTDDASPVQPLLVYVVVMLTTFVLKRFADPRPDVRTLASSIFTKLLILLPLEESAPEPQNPCMHPVLKKSREKGRSFVQCLLRPNEIRLYTPDDTIKAELRPYQQEGVNWLLFLKNYGLSGILADDLGLGKTLQTICALANHHRERPRRTKALSLVVCPPTLCSHWSTEVVRFVPNRRILKPVIYLGTQEQRTQLQKHISDRCNLLITTYDIVRNDVSFFMETFWEYLILDEGHIIKNSKSKVSRSVKKLRAKHRLILTGTPIQNRVNELWSLFDFLMPGFLGQTEASFVARFARPVLATCDPKASAEEQRAGQQALEELHRIVLPFVLRRLKEDVLQDLPPKVIQDYLCNMTPLQLKLYETFSKTEEGQHALSPPYSNDPSSARSGPGGFRSIKYLLAVCNHPSLVLAPAHPLYGWAVDRLASGVWGISDDLNNVQLSGKLVALRQLFIDCGFGEGRGGGSGAGGVASVDDDVTEDTSDLMGQHRALVFFQTKKMLSLVINLLASEFKNVAFLRLDGMVSVLERQELVTRFNEDPSIDMLLLTTSVGGLGLNLTGADTVIFVEHDWNPCKDLQAMDRAHRIGQRRMVNVYRLITADSIEERIMNLQAFKTHLARALVSQPANRSLAEMDTTQLLDNLTSSTGTDHQLLSDQAENSAGVSWGDLEATQYAEEYDMREFLSRLPHSSCE
uniref:TATA-binding protein-associated factor n=1 Tax=Mesocestoides corti TaxID=53468 RepID=A0A5K3ESK6_MESCO